jgi:hypothetical protein
MFLPSSIAVENLSFTPGVQVLSGSLPASIGSSNPGNGTNISSNLSTPIIFDPSANGGSWTISGTVRALRANIAETLSPALITEQGENGNQREYESEAQWIRRGGCGLARRGTERG